MGSWDEIDYKITYAQSIISRHPADKEGYLTMIGNNQISFRNKADVEREPETTQPPTDPLTGLPMEPTQEQAPLSE